MATPKRMLTKDQQRDVDAYADELVGNYHDPDLEPWEREVLGKSPVHRLARVGRDAVDQRTELLLEKAKGGEVLKDAPGQLEARKLSQLYFHQSGKAMMQMQLEDTEQQQEGAAMSKRAATAVKLLRRRIKVSDNEEGANSQLSIDQDWDTSLWKQDDIEAGMDYLLFIFVDPSANETHKKMSVVMIDRLLTRHWQAEFYLRDKLESIVSRAISRFIRDGRSAAQLDLLHIVHVGRAKYLKELSGLSFSGRAFEMMSLEARLAAILIQHTYRSHRAARNATERKVNPITLTFGGDLEMRFLREAAVQARSKQLRLQWAGFHVKQSAHDRATPVGFRGPCHMPQHYVTLLLDLTLNLVGPEAKDKVQANREDLLASGASVTLACFASFPFGPFSQLSIRIMSHACKVAASMQPMLEAGCVLACVRYMGYLESMGRLKWITEGRDNLANINDMSNAAYQKTQVPKRSFFDCILIITRLAVHAAGCHRARDGYDTVVPPVGDVEEISYRKVLALTTVSFNAAMVRAVLGQKKTLVALGDVIMRCNHLYCMRSLLLCWYSIACGDAQGPVMFEMVFNAGRLMERVLSMIEEEDLTVATLALCTFLQLCTSEGARETMMCAYIPKHLGPYTKCHPPHFHRKPYIRAILINCALLRQNEWRAYDPETAPGCFSSAVYMRQAVYLDLLKTSRNIPAAAAAKVTIADLIVLPADEQACKDMSIAAEMVGAKDLADFLVHPGDKQHTDRLPADEAVAGCVILEALCIHRPAAASLFNADTVIYLGRCLFILRWMFSGAPMSERQLMVTFQGVKSAAMALRGLAEGVKGDLQREVQMLQHLPDLEDPAQFFVGNLSIHQENMSVELMELQRQASVAVLAYLKCHVDIVMRSQIPLQEPMARFEPVGMEILKVVKVANVLYKDSDATFLAVLEGCCAVLETISQTEEGAKIVSGKWRSGESIKMHLPKPLSGVGPLGVDEEHYKTGLARMGPSLFRLLANLCLTGTGTSDCLSDGFLRRALDKVDILWPYIIDVIDPQGVGARPVALKNCSEDVQYKVMEMSGCLILVARCCNFASQVYGSANDMILQDYYDLFTRLHRIINRCDRVGGWDPLMDAALQCMSKLASDNVRLLNDFERVDIVALLRKVLLQLGKVPESVQGLAITTISVVAGSLRSDYLKESLPRLREPLAAVSTKHPELLNAVRGASWMVMKCIIDLEKAAAREASSKPPVKRGLNINWQPDHFASTNDSILNTRINELLEKAGLEKTILDEMDPSTQNSTQNSARDEGSSYSLGAHATSTLSAVNSLASPMKGNSSFVSVPDPHRLDSTGHLDHTDIGHLYHQGDMTGTMFTCGPSHCGSLRQQDKPASHGEWQGMSVADNHAHIAELPLLHADRGRLPLSDLSPRGVGDRIERHKSHKGFVKRKRDNTREAASASGEITDQLSSTLLSGMQSPIRRPKSPSGDKEDVGPNSANTQPLDLKLPKGAKKPLTGSQAAKSKKKSQPGAKAKKRKANTPVKVAAPMVVDIADCPGFLESRPPVFNIKDDDAFIC